MQFFDILCILLGIANGAMLPLLPDAKASKKPIGAILGFSLTFALFAGFLPVIAVLSPTFVSTLVLTLIGAVVGYYGMGSAIAPKEAKTAVQKRPAEIRQSA